MSVELTREETLRLVSEAGRAPSAHNTQPARWRFPGGGRVELWEDTRRRLPVGDPEQRDGRAALGMAFEGMALALSTRRLALGPPDLDPAPEHGGVVGGPTGGAGPLRRVAVAEIRQGEPSDPLAEWVPRRHTYRGEFAPAGEGLGRRLRRHLAADSDVVTVDGEAEQRWVGRLHDRCSLEFLRRPAYRRELSRWLRLSPRDVGWDRDGLSADCLAVSALEAWLARWALRPSILGLLVRCGLARPVVSEAAAVRSATALAILHCAADEDPFDAGRRWYRGWLGLCREGFSVCPMSALADSSRGCRALRQRYALPEDRRILNVLRIGVAPPGPVERVSGRSRRLPPDEVLLDPG